jgi:2,3-bisphosphoglycerate-independent phosphoglycerate mutase
VMYNKDNLSMTLGEVIAQEGKRQIRIAETEKYPHVTFFFNGGREGVFLGEKRILINSPKVATYDLQPEMSALLITEAILPEIRQQSADFICLNFANADMVGHTGNFKAVVKAVETVDVCLKQIVECGLQNEYSFLIIADHGNADYMINPDGSPNTAHSMNLVPCILIDSDYHQIHNGKLGDLAPTILHLLKLPIPEQMNGNVLI